MAKKPDQPFALTGRITNLKDEPLEGLTVRAFDKDPVSSDDPLGEAVTEAEGKYIIRFSEKQFRPSGVEFGGPDVYVRVYEDKALLGESPVARNAKPPITVDLKVDHVKSEPRTKGAVAGRVVSQRGVPAEGLRLRLYRRGFGGALRLLGEGRTDAKGTYSLPYSVRGPAVGLEVHGVDAHGKETPLSKPIHQRTGAAGAPRAVDLVAPASLQPLAAEYRRLAGDLAPHVGELDRLAQAREDGDRQDLTVLNRATGWDARLIALAGAAQRLSAGTGQRIAPEAAYGLLRAGLPSDRQALAMVEPAVAVSALQKAREAGVVALDDAQVEQFRKSFAAFAQEARLAVPAPGSQATYGDLLKSSGLAEGAQATFASVLAGQQGGSATLWQDAKEAGLADADIAKLQLQGKMAFLAGNSQTLTTFLTQMRMEDPARLVDQDLHRPEQWTSLMAKLSGGDAKALEAMVPTAYAGETVQDRAQAFADDMARKVRLSYPTQVLARTLETDERDSLKLGLQRQDTAALLKDAAAMGFRLGQTPVTTFLRDHEALRQGYTDAEFGAATRQLQKVQCLYQVTPSDMAMAVLADLRIFSAFDVMAYGETEFIALYEARYTLLYQKAAPAIEARLIFDKASQVSSITYNLFAIAKKMDSDPQVYGLSPPPEVKEESKNELIRHFPTMESLFGSLDYCECEHCRSVLSPAAYLVDLLQYTDPEDGVWATFTAKWAEQHGGHAYTDAYTTAQGQVVGPYLKPFDALVERRPDLLHIPLTCENTHTAMPYIDIVNEILEYYVAKGRLEGEAARDTGEATTAELLAEPQNVLAEAYDRLASALYPLTLPFDLWTETVRRFCDHFEAPLHEVLETFRRTDELEAPDVPYGRLGVFLESLGLAPGEAAILCEPDPLALGWWHGLYGYPRADVVAAGASGGQATATVPDAVAARFAAGDVCRTYDAATGGLRAEQKEVAAVGAPGSGGPERTRITFAGAWTAQPQPGDVLVLDAPLLLQSAKALARRLGVTYKEIGDIVRTGFVNPRLGGLKVLDELGITVQDTVFYGKKKAFYDQYKDLLGKPYDTLSDADKARFDTVSQADPDTELTGWQILAEVAGLEQRLTASNAMFEEHGFDAPKWLDDSLQEGAFDDVLVLADPDAGCSFDLTILQYADGRPADDIVYLKANLFVRLWRKLGWSIEETDRALQAFVPAGAPYEDGHLDEQPLRTALVYMAHLKALEGKVRAGKNARLKLLTLWTDLATQGRRPLYAQLFLNRGVLKADPVFDNPLGQYLTTASVDAMAQSRWHEVHRENVDPADAIDPTVFPDPEKAKAAYDALQEVQHLSLRGVPTDAQKAQLAALAPGSALLSGLLDEAQQKGRDYSLVKGHLLGLRGALGLTADEIAAILKDRGLADGTGLSLDDAPLTLANVSILYRYGLLAKGLKLSVPDLVALRQMSGLDPFKPIDAAPLTAIALDHPFTQTLRFVEVAGAVKETGFSVEDLDYLLRHRFDPTGKYRPRQEATLALLKTLAEGVRSIRAAHVAPLKPGDMPEETLRQKLALALQPAAVETLLAMVDGTVEFTQTLSGVASADQLDPADYADEPRIRAAAYDAGTGRQALTVRGVLLPTDAQDLKDAFPGSTVFDQLVDAVRQAAQDFFDSNLLEQEVAADRPSGFLDAADYGTLFGPYDPPLDIPATATPQEEADLREQNDAIRDANETDLRDRQHAIAVAFVPYLQRSLVRQLAVQALSAATGADAPLVEGLLTDKRLIDGPLLDALEGVGEVGVTAAFFQSPDGTGNALATVQLLDADTGALDAGGNPAKPANAASATLSGYLEVPAPGAYRFLVTLGQAGVQAEMRLEHLPEPVLWSRTAAAAGDVGGDQAGESAELKPGVPYRYTLHLRSLGTSAPRLRVQGETLPLGPLAQLPLYPLAPMQAGERAALLLGKAVQLAQGLAFTEREVRHLHAAGSPFAGLPLGQLPTAGGLAADAAAGPLFSKFLRLAFYVAVRRDLAGGTDDLVDVFEADAAHDLDKVHDLLAKLARREVATVRATSNALSAAPSYATEEPLRRLWQGLQVVERFGVPVGSLLAWTRIAHPGATAGQRFGIARDLREAIKARFDAEAWQRVAQPIFDRLRQRQRDALVAHIMHLHGFDRPEQLYEYFLVDPGMEPVVQTSRLRLAIGSVQLFVQRCLLNLERKVHPSAILNAKRWEWMKRYRVWEANRKIFLYPENYLEPEFRDDKSHLYAELEGALLQGDVSDDLVEDAFLAYLRKLDELARLDVVAMHLENTDDPATRVLHVFGRTFSKPHKLFYRRYAKQMWTPWEPVTAEVEGNQLVPVVWRGRLCLFWVTFLEKPENPAPAKTFKAIAEQDTPAPPRKNVEAHLHWAEYISGEWSTRESTGTVAPITWYGLSSFNPDAFFLHVSVEHKDGEERGVYVHLKGTNREGAIHLAGRNSFPEEADYTSNAPKGNLPLHPYGGVRWATKYYNVDQLDATFSQVITDDPQKSSAKQPVKIIGAPPRHGDYYSVLPCNNNITVGIPETAYSGSGDPQDVHDALKEGLPEIVALMKPIFYQDRSHTLFIEPTVTETTLERWSDWIPLTPAVTAVADVSGWLGKLDILAEIPRWEIGPWPPEEIVKMKLDDGLFDPVPEKADWLANEKVLLALDGSFIGRTGSQPIKSFDASTPAGQGTLLNVAAGSGIQDTQLVLEGQAPGGGAAAKQGIVVLSRTGVNGTMLKQINGGVESLDGLAMDRATGGWG